jgi:hypothetical protein
MGQFKGVQNTKLVKVGAGAGAGAYLIVSQHEALQEGISVAVTHPGSN